MPHDVRDQVVDFVRQWSERTEIGVGRFIHWLGVTASKFYDWRQRYGCVNEHNGWVSRDFWLEPWEKEAIVDFHLENPLEGYRRLTFMMLGVKILGGTFKESGAAKDLAEMQQGFKDLQANSKNQNAKLVVSLDSFEKQLEPFLDLPAAQAYRDLLRSFVDLTKTRNDKQVAYTQARIQSQTATSQADKMFVEFAQTTSTLAQSTNPALDDEEQFLSGYLQTSKQWIMEIIDLKRRALMYGTLFSTPIKLNFRDIRVVDLQTASDTLDREWVSALNQLPAAGHPQPFNAVFTLALSGNTDLRALLVKAGEVVFTIPTDYSSFNRGGTSFVSVTEVALDLTGVSSKSNRFTAQLEHSRGTEGTRINHRYRSRYR